MGKKVSTSKAVSAIFLGTLILVISQSIGKIYYLLPLPKVISSILFGITYVLLSYFFLQILCKKVFNYSLEECNIGKPKINFLWLAVAIILPVTVSVILIFTPGHFINNEMSANDTITRIIISFFTIGFGSGIVEEMIFRGFIMHILKQRYGKVVSIIVPSIIFGLLHLTGGMKLSDILTLFISGTSVGIMFSLIVYESKTIWSSAIVHIIWNIVINGEILNIGVKNDANSIYSYVLTSKSILVTGGHFGIESSIIAVVGYFAVIAFTIFRGYRNKNTVISI